MCALFDQMAFGKDKYPVGGLYGRQTMGNGYGGAVATDFLQCVLYIEFGIGIDGSRYSNTSRPNTAAAISPLRCRVSAFSRFFKR